jgi:hypothetical protein
MQNAYIVLAAAIWISGCAQAEPRGPKAIPDVEPEVTVQVSQILTKVAEKQLAPDQLTDNLRAALGAPEQQQMAGALQPCTPNMALELLQRTTKGEDRQYLYRLPCGGKPLLVQIDFNKGARINRLSVRPE